MTDQTITLNNNQATCMVERPGLTGRDYVNVCTGHVTHLPYTVVEIAGGAIFGVFFLFVAVTILTGFIRMGNMRSRF